MRLVEFHVELNRVADSLERIVFLLEKLVFPPPPADVTVTQSSLSDLHYVTPEDAQRQAQERAEFAERANVVPGSEAMMQAVVDWEDWQRRLNGETWSPPEEDWRTIFATVERNRSGGDSRAPSSSSGAKAEIHSDAANR